MFGMLSKLAWRNAKRSFKDYIIYLITVTLAFSLVFSFNLIISSKDILELTHVMNSLQPAIIFVSFIVLFVIGWLIHYTMKFMLQKRSKEFGTYMLLGIEKKEIIKMFLIENLLLGIGCLLLSFFIGFVFGQFLTMIIMNIFELPYRVNLSFGIMPFLLTSGYFIIIYLFVLLRANRKIKKMKLQELLYLDKTNESKIYKQKKHRAIVFLISFVLGIIAFLLFHRGMIMSVKNLSGSPMPLIFGSLVLIIFSIYGVSFSFADFLKSIALKNKKWKYQKDHLFIVRQFTSKVKTMGFTLGTLSLLITLTFLALNVSNAFQGVFENQTESSAPYDIMIYNLYSDTEEAIGKENTSLTEYMDLIEANYTIEEQVTYNVYTNRTTTIRENISDGVVGYQPFDCYLKLSDYNKLLQMRGMKPIFMQPDEFYIHTFRDVSKEIANYLEEHSEITVNGTTLKSHGFTDYKYTTSWSRGSSYIIIVPDYVIDEQFEVINQITAINTKEETTEAFANELDEKFPPKVYIEDQGEYETLISIQQTTVKAAVVNENRGMMTIISFSLMYLAFIFVAVVGTILSIQSLSDSTKYKYRYETLHKLGLNEKELNQTLQKQLIVFFVFPIIYPIFISILSSFSLNVLFQPFMTNDYSMLLYVVGNILLFLVIYLIYFLATYFSFKKNRKEV